MARTTPGSWTGTRTSTRSRTPGTASYIKLELDISALGGSPDAKAKLHVYRAGYTDTDNPAQPLKTFDIDNAVISEANRHAEHTIEFRSAFGQISLTIDGKSRSAINLNPMGLGGDYLPFGMLCDIGFSGGPGQRATFRDVVVRNNRAPNNILFGEDLAAAKYEGIYADAIKTKSGLSVANGRYVLDGGSSGAFVVRDPSHHSMPMLRTTFKAGAKVIDHARLYVTARGIYEVFLNGTRVGDDYYNPGLTQYNVTHLYQTYDVTRLIKPGGNALGAMLAEGWWSGLLSFGSIWNHFGDRQSLLAKLVIRYKDGTAETVTTNERTWKYYGKGPIVYSSLDFGEVYDASKESAVAGWATAPYNDSAWKPAVAVPLEGTTYSGPDGGGRGGGGIAFTFDRLQLIGQVGDSAGVFRTLTAKSVKEVRPGVFVYDMGQNMVGVPRVTVRDGRAGGTITLRYAEMLYPDLPASGKNVGMIMTENYRAALSQDVYIMKGGSQVCQPRFTSHGYRYVEITGLEHALPLTAVEGIVISSVRALTADYRSSSEKVNRLWSNLVWSNVGNFLTIPTDCPQRNERMGWSGDISVFSRTATYVSNADQFLTRHMYAMRDVQLPSGRFTDVAPVGGGFGGVLWGSAGIVVPWETYLQVQGRGPARTALPGNGGLRGLPGNDPRPEDRHEPGQHAGRLAGPAERVARQRVPGDGLSRIRPRHHGQGRKDPEQARGRREVPRAVRETQGVLQRDLRQRRQEDARDGAERIRSRAAECRVPLRARVPPRGHADLLRRRPRHGSLQRGRSGRHGHEPGRRGRAREQGR